MYGYRLALIYMKVSDDYAEQLLLLCHGIVY